MVYPIVVGTGRRLFGEGIRRSRLRLVDSKSVGPDKIQVLTYQQAR